MDKIDFTRINNDINGNPRYVCHFNNLLSEKENEDCKKEAEQRQKKAPSFFISFVSIQYELALKKAKKIGGKKFNNKQYGGGIVFQSYNIEDLQKDINNLKKG